MSTYPQSATFAGGFALPCIQPMTPAVKRKYMQILVIVIVTIVGINSIRPFPAPPGCRSELQA